MARESGPQKPRPTHHSQAALAMRGSGRKPGMRVPNRGWETPQGSPVGMPQASPLRKQPTRPTAWPSSTAGLTAAA